MPNKRLRVRIGPDFNRDNQETVAVNDEKRPVIIDSPHFCGKILMRIHNYKGVSAPLSGSSPSTADVKQSEKPIPTCKYFDGKKRCFSIQIQGCFKKEWTADDIEFGIVLDRRINLPTGSEMALKIAQVNTMIYCR
jgi:hypothetical protein